MCFWRRPRQFQPLLETPARHRKTSSTPSPVVPPPRIRKIPLPIPSDRAEVLFRFPRNDVVNDKFLFFVLLLLFCPRPPLFVSADINVYLDDISYPKTEDLTPERIFIHAVALDEKGGTRSASDHCIIDGDDSARYPTVSVSCGSRQKQGGGGGRDGRKPSVRLVKDPDRVCMPTTPEEEASAVRISHGSSFFVEFLLSCPKADAVDSPDFADAVLTFENFAPETTKGLSIHSFCHGRYSKEELMQSWTRPWAKLEPPAMDHYDGSSVVARLVDRVPVLEGMNEPMRVWDSLQIAMESASVDLDSTTIRLGCLKVSQTGGGAQHEGKSGGGKTTATAAPAQSTKEHVLPSGFASFGCDDGIVMGCPSLSIPCGFRFFPRKNSEGFNHKSVSSTTSIATLANSCLVDHECLAFNDNRWSKHTLRPQERWEEPYQDDCKGLYVKEACATERKRGDCPTTIPCGYNFFPTLTSPGNDLETIEIVQRTTMKPAAETALTLTTQDMLDMVGSCNVNSDCGGFDTTGALKKAILPREEWTILSPTDSFCHGLYVKDYMCNDENGACE